MSSAPRFALWPVVALCLGVGFCAGRTNAPLPPVSSDSLLAQKARLETLYVRDTQVFWRTKTRWDTLILSVDRWKTDTLQVVQYIQLADSSLRACASALQTCEQRLSIARQEADLQQKQLADSLHAARQTRWLWALAAAGFGVIIGHIP